MQFCGTSQTEKNDMIPIQFCQVCQVVYVVTNEGDGIFIFWPRSCPRGETWVCLGVKTNAVRPTVMLSPPKPLDKIWWLSSSHEWGVQHKKTAPSPWALGKAQKVKYHSISIKKSIYAKLFCVLTNRNYETFRIGFYSDA